MFTYINILTASNPHYSTYISSMKRHTHRKGIGFYGIDDKHGYDGIDMTVPIVIK